MKPRALLCAVLFAACSLAAQTAQVKAVRFGTLIDGRGKVWKDAVVLIAGDKVQAVTSDAAQIPPDATVIDLRRFTGIPGLIDMHTHMTYYWDRAPGTRPFGGGANRLPQVTVFLAQENARKTLETGVTTVRDLGSSDYNDIAMRDLINRGAMLGPRMFVSGYGLHISSGRVRPGFSAPAGGTADGVPEVIKITRQQLGAGADVIKMYGSTGSDQDLSGFQTFTFDEMKAAADVAHALGKKIAVHSYGPKGATDAVRAGADSIEHAVDMDAATLQEMARRHTFYVPTIDHNRYYAEFHEEYGFGPEVVKRLNEFIPRNLETTRQAIKAGVPLAMGSDAVFSMFGQNTRELEWFVKAGLSPAQALATATSNAASLLGMEDRLGAVAPGYFADLVAVEGDPLVDISVVIHNVRWVMKGGQVVVDKTR